jgi:transcriptional regulator with XRE-family HTH domain
MANRERRMERATRLMAHDLQEVAFELRAARLRSGLTLQEVADAMGVSPSAVFRTEKARTQGLPPETLARHAAALGLRARIRVFPEGDPIRDAGQLALIRQARERLGPHLAWTFEVPIPLPGDRRAFDAVVTATDGRVGLEFFTRLSDAQAQLRAVHLKQRDAGLERSVIVLKATTANRRALRLAGPAIVDLFPGTTRRVLGSLATGRIPETNGVVLL